MHPSEEQRFDFGEVRIDPVSSSELTKRRRARTKSTDPDTPVGTPEPVPAIDADDDVARRLKERIERLNRRAAGTGSPPTSRKRTVDLPSIASDIEDEAEGAPSDDGRESLSIAQFYARVKQALVGQFPEELWVTGEIRSIRVSNGHRFMELADQGAEGRATQQLEVACWSTQWRSVEASLRAAGVELEVGRVIRVLGKVSIWEAASRLRFTLSQIDVEALLGSIAAARQKLLNTLETEGLLHRNAELVVPPVPLRIGLVTSQGSEAQKDFLGQLQRSPFAFEVELVHSLVQGADAPGQIARALDQLRAFGPDLCVIVRGGGSRNDLAAFDSEIVARAIANAEVPIWVGIGHTGDHSVADVVAGASFITPTACGEAVVARVGDYWNGILERVSHISGVARTGILGAQHRLAQQRHAIGRSVDGLIVRHERSRIERRARVASAASHLVRAQRSELIQRQMSLRRAVVSAGSAYENLVRQRAVLLRAFAPERQLARGWAILRDVDGHLLRSIDEVRVGSKFVARVSDGEIGATVDVVRALRAQEDPSATNEEHDQEERP